MKQVYESEYKEILAKGDAFLRSVLTVLPDPPPPPPPSKEPFRGALAVVYGNMKNVELYGNGDALIAGRTNITHHLGDNADKYAAARSRGAEIYQYVVVTERPDRSVGAPETETYYQNALDKVPLWPYPKNAPGTRTKWVGGEGESPTKMTDVTINSPWLTYNIEYISKLMISGKVDGVFLDAMGARPWSSVAAWDTWSLEEKDAYTTGLVSFLRRLWVIKETINPKFCIVTNGIWDRRDGSQIGFEAERWINGTTIEHHKPDSAFHAKYIARPFGDGKIRRCFAIGRTQAEATRWFANEGVTHVSGQDSYTNALEPAV